MSVFRSVPLRNGGSDPGLIGTMRIQSTPVNEPASVRA